MENHPEFLKTAFDCPFCCEYTQQKWYNGCISELETDIGKLKQANMDIQTDNLKFGDNIPKGNDLIEIVNLHFTCCLNCEKISIWSGNKLVWPNRT